MPDSLSATAETQTARIVFLPSGRRGEVPAGLTLLQAAQRLGADLASACGGRGICGRCQVDVIEGEVPRTGIVSSAASLTDWNEVEASYASRRGALPAGRRLGCQAHLCGDVVVDVPASSQLHRQVVRKEAAQRDIVIDPVVRLLYVEVPEPRMDDPASDSRRLVEALRSQWNLGPLSIARPVLLTLQKILREGNWTVTAAVRNESEIVALYPGYRDRALGLAVDIGSTTIAAHLCDLASGEVLASAGLMNPQIRFGEDLMSRVSAIMMDKTALPGLIAAVREGVADLAIRVAADAGAEAADILETVVVGNPIMHHLFLGLDPTELGGAPFALAVDEALDTRAADLGLPIAQGSYIHTLPCIAGHVGADTAGVVLSEAPHQQDAISLIVDVGTNAEIVLGNRDRLLACSSPTGPAFEGAHISCGQRAAPGAIERIRIDRNTLEPRFKVIGCDLWSNEPGFAEATARTGVTGVCGSGIVELIAELYLSGIVRTDGSFDEAITARTPRVETVGRSFAYVLHEGPPRLVVYQTDIRAIQLAKAALYAGARILMDKLGVNAVDRIVLAGAFGTHIDPLYAMALGMVPDCNPARIASAGNAAGTGARIALLNRASRTEIANVTRQIEKIETAIEPSFQHHFVGAMGLPHASDAFPQLGAVMTLPERSAESGGRRKGGRRRHQ